MSDRIRNQLSNEYSRLGIIRSLDTVCVCVCQTFEYECAIYVYKATIEAG